MKLLEFSISYLIGSNIIENNKFPEEIFNNMFLRFNNSQKLELYYYITNKIIENLIKYDIRINYVNAKYPLDIICDLINKKMITPNILIINDLLEWQKLAKILFVDSYKFNNKNERYIEYFSYENNIFKLKYFYF